MNTNPILWSIITILWSMSFLFDKCDRFQGLSCKISDNYPLQMREVYFSIFIQIFNTNSNLIRQTVIHFYRDIITNILRISAHVIFPRKYTSELNSYLFLIKNIIVTCQYIHIHGFARGIFLRNCASGQNFCLSVIIYYLHVKIFAY